jgi:mycothiol synthase
MDLHVVDLAELGTPERTLLSELLRRAADADDEPPLPEPQRLAVTHPRRATGTVAGRVVLARDDTKLVGSAFVFPARDESTTLYVVVDPTARTRSSDGDVPSSLIDRAVAVAAPGTRIHLWAMHAGPDDDERARQHGFVPERDLLQMRVALPLPLEVVGTARPLATRAFVPGRDDVAWVETNNRAFAGHPEQSSWTVEELRERMAADWVDVKGFLVADDPDGDGLIGSCWTKIHRDQSPVMGEIYVIAVDPRHHGQGWGRSLTVAGLESLSARGVTVGMLYTEADNKPAVALYRSLGFSVDHLDRSYRRDIDPVR